ncbi:MAG TPA: carbamoyltransferase N-terminal domain-containing protein [Thermoanaerobaculia bacterium]|nr:carbamoyltransferase N-terminal domain-containing protein [Thermoanaerobaculia bacterium]
MPPLNIVGLSAFFHESACCLLRDGQLVAAAEEERFSRVKHDPRLPVSAFRWCLKRGGIGIMDVDAVAYYEDPVKKLGRQLWAGVPAGAAPGLAWLDPGGPERAIREGLGFEGPILTFDHHLSHAASAFFFSGFPEAALLTVDGVGEWATTTYGRGHGGAVELFEEVEFPHSLGLLYSTLTSYLGFEVNDGEYKVMGLAPYGEPRYLAEMRRLVSPGLEGKYRLDLRYFDFVRGRRMYSEALPRLFGAPPRQREAEITQLHQDVARSLQAVLEEILLGKVLYLHARTGLSDLCMAGGVALNVVANGRILREGPFERLFVQPAAGDSGGCLGAAALAHVKLTGERPGGPLPHVYLGPSWRPDEIAGLLAATGLPAHDFRGREAELLEAVVDRLEAGKVVGWFHGALELGPRALGARSLLADPRDPGMRDRLNRLVKKREAFRPFAPSVLAAHAAEHFDLDHSSPFMLETCQVTSPLGLPAITHVDGSARPQTVDPAVAPRYAALLEAFRRRTGCPMLVNTSFNVRGEPIVGSPVDALFSLGSSGVDALVLEDFLIDREMLPASWAELIPAWRERARSGFARGRSAVSEDLYTFV